MLLQSTQVFKIAQEIYARQLSNDSSAPEHTVVFTHNNQTHVLWGIGVTDYPDPKMDPDGFDLDPLYTPPLDENGEPEIDEEFNPEIDESELHVVVCTANEDYTADGKRIVLDPSDSLLQEILTTAREVWPELKEDLHI